MILALPYHPLAPVDFKQVVSDVKRLAGNRHHTVLLLSRPEDEQQGLDYVMTLSKHFGDHYHGVLATSGVNLIDTANLFFKTAMRFLARYERQDYDPEDVPLLYLDPNWKPKSKNWLGTLQSEWFERGKPDVMGHTQGSDPPIFQGGVVVGPKFASRSTLLNYLSPQAHWRSFLSGELLQNHALTDLIGTSDDAVLTLRED